MFIYHKYAPDGTNIVVLSYVDDLSYWYTSRYLVKRFVGNLGNRSNVNFLGYAHWFMSNIISHMRYHSISVDQASYATSIVAKYLDTETVNTSKKFYNNSFSSDMIFTKADASTKYEQVDKFTR